MEEKDTQLSKTSNNEVKEFSAGRFEFALFVNENLVCKRNFRIPNFIEGSMQTLDFASTVDECVTLIDNDLKSKSRVYIWYYFEPDLKDDPMMTNNLKLGECTFKFVIYDNEREVFSKIWDGYGYPSMVRNNIDLTNSIVKIISRAGDVYTYDRAYFEANADKLWPDLYVRKCMFWDKPNLIPLIIEKIVDSCSSKEDGYENINDYDTLLTFGKGANKVTYNTSLYHANKKYFKEWEKAVSAKTAAYEEMYAPRKKK